MLIYITQATKLVCFVVALKQMQSMDVVKEILFVWIYNYSYSGITRNTSIFGMATVFNAYLLR